MSALLSTQQPFQFLFSLPQVLLLGIKASSEVQLCGLGCCCCWDKNWEKPHHSLLHLHWAATFSCLWSWPQLNYDHGYACPGALLSQAHSCLPSLTLDLPYPYRLAWQSEPWLALGYCHWTCSVHLAQVPWDCTSGATALLSPFAPVHLPLQSSTSQCCSLTQNLIKETKTLQV